MKTGVGSKNKVLSKYVDQKVFLFEGFRLTPGYLKYSHGDWWLVKSVEETAFFLGTDLISVFMIGGILRVLVSEVNRVGGFNDKYSKCHT